MMFYQRLRLALLSTGALFFLQACDPVNSAPAGDHGKRLTSLCRYVVDGDSLYLHGEKRQIRLWGVDAPERGKPGYHAARLKLEQLALNRKLHCDEVDTDKYGRIVARCFLATDKAPAASTKQLLEVNRVLIDSGVAKEYCWFSKGHYGHC